MVRRLTTWAVLGSLVGFLALATPASAVPALQLWIEPDNQGPLSYSSSEESWVKLGTTSFRLWVIGNGGDYDDVRLVMSFAGGVNPQFSSMTGSTTGVNAGTNFFGNFGDTTTPADPTCTVCSPTAVQSPGGGALNIPPLANIEGAFYIEFALGDFANDGTKITDFSPGNYTGANANGLFGTWAIGSDTGQINVYEFTFDLANLIPVGTKVFFDAYSCEQVTGNHCSPESPFSHDARWEQTGTPIPEPGTLLLLGSGLAGLTGWATRRRRS